MRVMQQTEVATASPPMAPAPAAPAGERRMARIRDYGIVGFFLALFVVLSVSSDVFLTSDNLSNMVEQWAPIGIMACAGTLVLIAGGLDISVGAIFALSGVVAAKAANATDSALIGWLAGCGAGAALGACNGFVTTVGRVNSIIGTLASGLIVRGLAIAITGGFIVEASDAFGVLGKDRALGLSLSTYVLVVWVVVMIIVLHRTVFGRYIYAAGDNPEAARLSGVPVHWVRGTTFVISGLSAGIAGVIAASRVGAGQAEAGAGIEFQVLAAIVLGGVSLVGGAGAVWRTVLGVLLLAMIGNGLNLLGVDPLYQMIVQGGIILIAVAVDAWAQRSRP
jgi:ribose transport system permease protein